MKKGDIYIHLNNVENSGVFIRGEKVFVDTDFQDKEKLYKTVEETKKILLSRGYTPIIHTTLSELLVY